MYAKGNYDMSSPYWYSYTVTNGTVSLGKGANWPADLAVLTLPSTLNGYPVTDLAPNAFQNCTSLTSVTMQTTLRSISQYAFNGCRGLRLVTIPVNVTIVGDGAFSNCSSLSRVTFTGNLQSIGSYVFSYCTFV